MKYEPTKPPIELMRKGDENEKVLAYACGVCGMVCSKELATNCCAKRWCDCGEVIDKPYTACHKCMSACRTAKHQAHKDKAEKIAAADWVGAVYWDEDDSFYSDVGEVIEAIEDEVEYEGIDPASQTIWACYDKHLVLDAGEIIGNTLESDEHHEDADVSQAGHDALAEFLKGWNERYGRKVITSWADEKRLIVVDWED